MCKWLNKEGTIQGKTAGGHCEQATFYSYHHIKFVQLCVSV